MGLAQRPEQAEIYDRTFRSDLEAVSYYYALKNDHLPDFDNPVWINEKVRSQFVGPANPLMGLAADKIAVRDYLRFKGAEIAAPELIATGSSPGDLAATRLPARFALKASVGSGQNHLEHEACPTDRSRLVAMLKCWSEHDHWRHLGELHYRGVPKRWLIEELVTPHDRVVDYKFFCIHGEPVFVLVIADRVGRDYSCALFDLDWKPVDYHWRGFPTSLRGVDRPARLGQMIEEARRLSEDFLHVRVDFMQCGERLLFSELTFSGGAARNPFEPLLKNVEFGGMLDLAQSPTYLSRGKQIAASLGWTDTVPVYRWTAPPETASPALRA